MCKPLFIVGIGRSGTTLARLMLNSHPNLAIPYESQFLTDYYFKQEEYGDLEEKDNLKRLVTDILQEELLQKWDHDFSVERIVASVETNDLSGVLGAVFKDYMLAKNKTRWGDKSDYLDRMHVINEIFPDCQFLHIVRDGRDVANSVLRLPWGPADWLAAAEWWHTHIKLGTRMGAMLPKGRYLEVRFEDLVRNPETALRKICEFLGEPYDPAMLDYHKKGNDTIPESQKWQHKNTDAPPNQNRIEAWKKDNTDVEIALFQEYASKSLEEMGYDIKPVNISRFSITLAKFRFFVKRAIRG